MRAAASRTFWTAGTSRPISTAIMAMTTTSSMRDIAVRFMAASSLGLVQDKRMRRVRPTKGTRHRARLALNNPGWPDAVLAGGSEAPGPVPPADVASGRRPRSFHGGDDALWSVLLGGGPGHRRLGGSGRPGLGAAGQGEGRPEGT